MTAFDRATALARLGTETFDLLVIGGGVTGAGVALDAAARGLRTAIVERDDWASGTSSKSSKLVHGGLRYLQQKEYRLVYENLAERQRLLDNAPHLVSELPFLIPLFGKDGVVNAGLAKAYSTALWLYDLTGGLRIGKRHKRVSREEALRHLPTLRPDRLVAAFVYYDARTDDARLTLALVRTAVAGPRRASPSTTSASPVCCGSGWPGGRERRSSTARRCGAAAVVNAAGVWSDDVRALDEGIHPDSIRPAKGIHITVPSRPAAVRHRRGHPGSRGPPVDLRRAMGRRDLRRARPTPTTTARSRTLQCTPGDIDYLLDAVNGVTIVLGSAVATSPGPGPGCGPS